MTTFLCWERRIIEHTNYVVNLFCDRIQKFGSRQTALCALRNDWPQRTLSSTRCIIVLFCCSWSNLAR